MTPTPAPVQAYSQAVALLQQGHFGQAEKIAVRAQKTWPNSFDLLHLLGVIRLQCGKPGSALGLFEQALRLQPDSPDATSNMAMTLSMLGRRDEALVLFDKACALNPADWQIRNSRGVCCCSLIAPKRRWPILNKLCRWRHTSTSDSTEVPLWRSCGVSLRRSRSLTPCWCSNPGRPTPISIAAMHSPALGASKRQSRRMTGHWRYVQTISRR